jgi:hypothetical protein
MNVLKRVTLATIMALLISPFAAIPAQAKRHDNPQAKAAKKRAKAQRKAMRRAAKQAQKEHKAARH